MCGSFANVPSSGALSSHFIPSQLNSSFVSICLLFQGSSGSISRVSLVEECRQSSAVSPTVLSHVILFHFHFSFLLHFHFCGPVPSFDYPLLPRATWVYDWQQGDSTTAQFLSVCATDAQQPDGL